MAPQNAHCEDFERELSCSRESGPSQDHTGAGPKQIGRYAILRRLGSGGMGDVYLAFDPKLRRNIALKVFRATEENSGLTGDSSHTQSMARQLMLVEAQSMAKLSHPNIVPIFDVGTVDEGVFLAMEFISGKSLRQWFEEEGTKDWRSALRLVWQAGQGLEAVHRAGFVHRDFKPENIMIGADGLARLLDFGLASDKGTVHLTPVAARNFPQGGPIRLDTISTTYTRVTQAIAGTPGYLAPEQFQDRASDSRSDQFAFGIVLFEAIYGHRPFSSTSVFQAQCSSDLTPEFPRRGSKRIKAILRRALAFDPEDRYPSLKPMLAEIEQTLLTRRAFYLALALVGLSIVGITQLVLSWSQHASTCNSARDKMEAIWDRGQQHQAKAAFLASGHSFAEETWRKTSLGLDDYRLQWITSYEQICHQNLENADAPNPLVDSQMRCLERRRQQFRALAELFAEATPPVVEQAIAAILQLKSAEDCRDPETNDESFPLPDDPKQRSEILDIQQRLDRIKMLIISGKLEEAERLAQVSLDEAESLDYPPLLIDVYFGYADVVSLRWQYQRAIPLQQAAVALALSIDDSSRAAKTIGYLLNSQSLVAMQLSNLKDPIGWAKALVERAKEDPEMRGNLYNSIGNIYLNFGQYPSAKLYYLDGLEFRGATAFTRAALRLNLGQCFLNEQKLDDALIQLEMSQSLMQEVYGERHPQLSHVTSLLGSLAYLRGNSREALSYMDTAISFATRADGTVGAQALPAYYHRGFSLEDLGRIRDAAKNAQNHLDADEELMGKNHPRICGDFQRLIRFLVIFGDRDQSLLLLKRLEAVAATQTGEPFCEASLGLSRAQFFVRNHQLEAAQKQLESMSNIENVIVEPTSSRQSVSEIRLELLEAQGRYLAVKQMLEVRLEALKTLDPLPLPIYASALLKLASIEQQLGNYEAAHEALQLAEERLEKLAGADSLRQAEVELVRGKIFLDQKQWLTAHNALQRGLQLADEKQSSPLLLADLEHNLAKANLQLSDFRSETSTLARRSRDRLVGLLDPIHPRLQRINQFLVRCCASR